MPDTIDKRAEELAHQFNEDGHLKYDADEKPLAALIAAALRKERQEAKTRFAQAYMQRNEAELMDDIGDYRIEFDAFCAAIFKED